MGLPGSNCAKCEFVRAKCEFVRDQAGLWAVIELASWTGNKFPVTKKFFLSQEKFLLWQILCSFCDNYYTPFIISSILPDTGSFSCNKDIFHVTKIVPPITRRTVCVTWSIFSVTEMCFHFALSEETFFHVRHRNYFFLWHKMYFM